MSSIARVYHADADGHETRDRGDAVGFGAKLSCGHSVFNLSAWGSKKPHVGDKVTCSKCSIHECVKALVTEALIASAASSPKTAEELRTALSDERTPVLRDQWVKGKSGTWSVTLEDGTDVKLTLSCSSEEEMSGRLRVGRRTTRMSISVFCFSPMYRNLYHRAFATVKGEDAEARKKLAAVRDRVLKIANTRFGLNAGEFDFDYS